MLRYLTPQLRRTYGAVVRTLMPWRVIDALSNLDDAEKRGDELKTAPPSNEGDRADPGPPSTKV